MARKIMVDEASKSKIRIYTKLSRFEEHQLYKRVNTEAM